MPTIASIKTEIYIRTATLARVHDRADLGATQDDDFALEVFIQRGCIDIARRTERLEAVVPIALEEDVFRYAVPGSMRGIMAIEYAGTMLKHIAGKEARISGEKWDPANGPPTHFGVLQGQIHVYPTPSLEEDGKTMTVYYLLSSAQLAAADPDFPTEAAPAGDILSWLPPELESALVNYAVWQWFQDLGEYSHAQIRRGIYEEEVEDGRSDPRKPHKARGRPRYF